MKDPRLTKLAKNILEYSCKLEKGQSIIIEASARTRDLVVELVRQVYKIGAYPFVRLADEQVTREVLKGVTPELSKLMCEFAKPLFEHADAYISILSNRNSFETSDVPMDRKLSHMKYYGQPIHIDIRAAKHNWVLIEYPSPSMAQSAQMPYEAFEDFYFEVCTMDYGKMRKAMQPLKDLMERTDKVRIVAKDTDLTFSIKGQKACICSGESNIPDGEVFTSPIKDSINGQILFNTPSMRGGVLHDNIMFKFKDGKIIEATSSNTKALTQELDTDEGARYIGEFALGVNPRITKPMNDTLFDEKIGGSLHMAVGNCIKETPNGNKSSVHWDIILRGIGFKCEIWFDDVLIRKDGKFLLKELKNLEELK
ncbi:MAG: aminopeptidase [Firmicutes bacterium]|nr:aminopeptidase [Bacillota bacterium]